MKKTKYYLAITFLLAVLILPNFASAITLEELEAKIKDLEQQLGQLKALLTELKGQSVPAQPSVPIVAAPEKKTEEKKETEAAKINSPVVQIAGYEGSLCVLTKNGLVFCQSKWTMTEKGVNRTGGLGTGNDFTAVSGLIEVANIAVFDNNLCAVKKDGSAFCLGKNSYGQLGDGTLVDKIEPTPVSKLGAGTTVSISMGRNFACALKTNGSVVCWGSNDTGTGGGGQIGHGNETDTVVLFPTQVSGLGPRSTLAIFSDYSGTCAIKTDHSVVCWGEISPIGYVGTYTPVKALQNFGAVKSLSFGFKATCALKTNGSVVCQGSNYCGQLGNNKGKNALTMGLGSTIAIATESYHSCALKTDGSLVCWGCNGKVGAGTIFNQYTPVQVRGLGPGTTAAIADNASCAVKTDGSVVCWFGEASVPTPFITPVSTSSLPVPLTTRSNILGSIRRPFEQILKLLFR